MSNLKRSLCRTAVVVASMAVTVAALGAPLKWY